MSIAETETPRSGRVYTCLINELVKADDKPDAARERIASEFADKGNSNRALAKWLGVSESTVSKHRDGICWCGRTA